MKKRIGVLFCALLAMVALTLSFALPASAADDTFVIGVYYYDADGNPIKTNQYLGELPEYFGGSLTLAQQVIDDIHTHAPLFNAARTEIRLFADVPTALTIPANTTTTLNLNGFTLSAADGTAPLTVAEGGALTITDTSENKTGKIAYTGSAAVSAIENHGRLTIETANVSTASSTAALISNSGETRVSPSRAAILTQTARATLQTALARASRSRAVSSPKKCLANTVRQATSRRRLPKATDTVPLRLLMTTVSARRSPWLVRLLSPKAARNTIRSTWSAASTH